MTFWAIPTLFGLSLGLLAYTLLRAVFSGAEVYSGTYAEATAREFEDIFLFIPPRRIAEAGWAASASAFLLVLLLTGRFTSLRGVLLGVLLGLVAGVLALNAPRALLRILQRRRLRRFNEQLVDTLITMSNALKAGFSITQAFETVAREGQHPISQEFGLFLQQTRLGVSFTDALQNLERRVGSDDMTLVALAIETARQTGGNLTEIFERISATIRERMRIEGRIRTLTAQGRMQGIIAGSMPAVIAAVLLFLRPELMMPFLHSSAGIAVAAIVAVLIFCGAMIIRKIIRIDV